MNPKNILRSIPSPSRFFGVMSIPVFLVGAVLTTTVAPSPAEALGKCKNMELICPGGKKVTRNMKWDKTTLRCVPIGSMRKAVERTCRAPFGVPKHDLNWWYKKASQSAACSAPGPLKDAMSGNKFFPIFHEACVMHDLCYAYPRSKRNCEEMFRENLRAACHRGGVLESVFILGCLGAAEAIYATAKDYHTFGAAYRKRQDDLDRHQTRWRIRNRVYLDCNHSGVGNEWSKSKITIRVLNSDKKVVASKTFPKGISRNACKKPFKILDRSKETGRKKSLAQGRHVVIATAGGDGFLIDEIRLKVDHRKDIRWGRDNGKAWCLSTEKDDVKGKWKKVASTCLPNFIFHSNGKTYKWR